MLQTVDPRTLQAEAFRADVLAGLARRQKALPSRWLYDDRGCELFEAITKLEEYYPTRAETAILRMHAAEIADFCGKEAVLLEYGAGAAFKTEILLGALATPRLYVPIDIAGNFLQRTAARIRRRFARLQIRPLAADFTADFEIPSGVPLTPRIGFFPGSTIGNLDEAETLAFLSRMRAHVGPQGKALIGVDLKKNIPTLLAAYDDKKGVTAAFNLNLLARVNCELRGTFALDRYAHEARWNDAESAVEMHLVSLCRQRAAVAGRSFAFAAGETIHTESSRKYSADGFADFARRGGWKIGAMWTDRRFGVFGMCAA